jgi:hypothetical protein
LWRVWQGEEPRQHDDRRDLEDDRKHDRAAIAGFREAEQARAFADQQPGE